MIIIHIVFADTTRRNGYRAPRQGAVADYLRDLYGRNAQHRLQKVVTEDERLALIAYQPEALREDPRTRVMIRIRLTEDESAAPQRASGREFSPSMKCLTRAFVAAHMFVYRRSGGRLGGRMGTAAVFLLTTGRKTGGRRTVPLRAVESL